MNDITFLDATAQADLVRNKQVKPIELAEAAIERIERLNPKLNAVVRPMYDQAREAATGAIPQGPFAGVPFLLKDLGATYGGVVQTQGTAFLKDFVSPEDSELTRRFKAAGLIILGKTNTPELGLLPTTEPHLFGPARNPWNTDRTTGGSSGGSAAAVASGMVSIAHANDGGGSIRIPASCCGLFGIKPSRGRNSLAPRGDDMSGLVQEHVLTRTVRDSAAMLDAVSGPVPGDPYYAPPPARPFLQEVGADPGRLRIAVSTDGFMGQPVAPDCQAAVKETVALLQDLGHEVQPGAPQIDTPHIVRSFLSIWAAGCTATIDEMSEMAGRPAGPEYFEPLTWSLYEQGKGVTGAQYLLAWTALHAASRAIGRFFERYDLWLTSTLGEPPIPIGELVPPGTPLMGMQRAAAFVPYTPVQNATGQPAMSVPLHWSDEGLPIGVHFSARYAEEATLFRLAAQLEEARPWANKRPPVSAV